KAGATDQIAKLAQLGQSAAHQNGIPLFKAYFLQASLKPAAIFADPQLGKIIETGNIWGKLIKVAQDFFALLIDHNEQIGRQMRARIEIIAQGHEQPRAATHLVNGLNALGQGIDLPVVVGVQGAHDLQIDKGEHKKGHHQPGNTVDDAQLESKGGAELLPPRPQTF